MAKFITNKQRQEELNIEKYYASMEEGKDLSGKRYYCYFCDKQLDETCTTEQENKDALCLCAKAFNKWNRSAK